VKYTKDVWNKAKETKQLKELELRESEKVREEKRIKRKSELESTFNKDDRKRTLDE
jgi:hypothetical protein